MPVLPEFPLFFSSFFHLCLVFVFIQYINIYIVPNFLYVELIIIISFLTCYISNSLNSAVMPLSNKQTNLLDKISLNRYSPCLFTVFLSAAAGCWHAYNWQT